MSETQATVATETQATVATPAAKVKPKAKRFTFGPVWTAAVRKGDEKFLGTHREKLVAHAVSLKIGARSDLSKLKLTTLIARTQAKLAAPVEAAPAAEAAPQA